MAKAKEQMAAGSPAESEQSIDEIMNNIKEVITNTSANDEVLVLTEKVEAQNSEVVDQDELARQMERDLLAQQSSDALQAQVEANAEIPANDDILAQLDENTVAPQTDGGSDMTQVVEQLVRDDVASSAKSMISDLMTASGKTMPHSIPSVGDTSHTIEQLVMALLKPELKNWLDKNLEPIVREIIQKEIQRIVPK
jgi:uncharacterized protein